MLRPMEKYSLVLGDRQQLRAEIQSHIAGHEHFGKPTGALLAAFEAIDTGADEARAGDFVYRVRHDSHPSSLSRTDYRQGTRGELLAELAVLRDDVPAGRHDKVAQYDEAIADLGEPKLAACTSALGIVYLVAQTSD